MFGPADLGMRLGKSLWDPEVQGIISKGSETVMNSGKYCVNLATSNNVPNFGKSDTKIMIIPASESSVLANAYSSEIMKIKSVIENKE